MNVKEYAAQVAKDAGLSDDQAKAFLDTLSNEKVSKSFEDAMLMRSDYSRKMNEMTDAEKRAKAANDKWYADQLAIAAKNQETVNEYDAQLKKYRETYGELDGTVKNTSVDTSNFIDKKTFDETLAKQGQDYLSLLETGMQCAGDYIYRFKEPLDVPKLKQFAIESGLPLKLAYEKFIEPKVKEIEGASFAEKLKKAREEGLTEGLSKRDNPTDTGPAAPNGFMGNLLKKTEGAPNPKNSFVEEWNKAASK